MNLRALLIIGGLGLATFASAEAKDKRPKTSNPNVTHAMKCPVSKLSMHSAEAPAKWWLGISV